MNVSVFVIIVTYKGIQWYDRCLSSLRNSTLRLCTIVVDNASNDGSVEYIRQNYPEVIVIESEKNLGFGQANNVGIVYAMEHGCDYIFLLNQDAWLCKANTIEELLLISQKYPQYAILSPLQLYGSGERITKGLQRHLIENSYKENDCVSDYLLGLHKKDVYDLDYICAASWFIPCKTITKIGGFDPLFFHYGEDDNYIQRLKYFNLRLGVVPSVCICHDTEDREAGYGQQNNNWKKDILLILSDINSYDTISYRKHIKYKLKAFLKNIVCFRIKNAVLIWNQVAFMMRKKRDVEYSVLNNKRGGSVWLNGIG